MPAWLPTASFAVEVLILAGLTWYAVETYRLRKASQEQLEALHRPCLTILTTARRAEDAVLRMNGIEGGMVVQPRAGDVVLQNIGTGPAFNIRYKFNCGERLDIEGVSFVYPIRQGLCNTTGSWNFTIGRVEGMRFLRESDWPRVQNEDHDQQDGFNRLPFCIGQSFKLTLT